ncbi:hypothetical protein I4U23_021064 [Adineta vaga]|nr:hypothetical protein I4U23_021064 [Adineta vaga]
MGRKKKKQMKPWCWYCNREFDDEKILLEHQKARHFKCLICRKKLFTGPGLQIHSQQVHNERIDKVPNAIKGRESIEIEIHGMEGIPEADLRTHERRLNGKDDDEPDSTDVTAIHSLTNMPSIPHAGMMPIPFTGMPFGMPPLSLSMMPLPMMTQLRPPMPMMSAISGNQIASTGPTSVKPLFPSGTTDPNNCDRSSSANTSDSLSDNRIKIEPVPSTSKLIHPDDDISLEEFRASLPKYKQMMMMLSMPCGFPMNNFIPPGIPFMVPPSSFSSTTINGLHF